MILLLLLFLSPEAQGQEPDPGEIGARDPEVFTGTLRVRAKTSPSIPFAGEPWTVTILAEYPNPAEVTVRPPRFPPPVVLERVRTGNRLVWENSDSPEEAARWTAVEFLFTLQSPGALELEPFEISVPGRRGNSGKISLQVRQRRNAGQYNPSFHWENFPPYLRLGEQGELTLVLSNWDPRLSPPGDFFQGRPPLNCLLEPLGDEVRGIYRWRIIPFQGDRLEMESWTFAYEGYTLRVPGLSIPLKGAEILDPSRASPGEGLITGDAGKAPAPENRAFFPEEAGFLIQAGRMAVLPPFRGFYDYTVERARGFWLENKTAEALAGLRRAEASALTGAALIPLRQELEGRLGLGPTLDENRNPLGGLAGILSGLFPGFLFLLGAGGLFFFRKKSPPPENPARGGCREDVTFFGGKGYKIAVILVLAGAGLGLIAFSLGKTPENFRGRGVMKGSVAFRVPDSEGAVAAWFEEGQPVFIRSRAGNWIYAESPDGRAGWVSQDAVVDY